MGAARRIAAVLLPCLLALVARASAASCTANAAPTADAASAVCACDAGFAGGGGQGGSPPCLACAPGTFKDSAGPAPCRACPPASAEQYSTVAGASACYHCVPSGTPEPCAAAVLITVRTRGIAKDAFLAAHAPRFLLAVERTVAATAGSGQAASAVVLVAVATMVRLEEQTRSAHDASGIQVTAEVRVKDQNAASRIGEAWEMTRFEEELSRQGVPAADVILAAQPRVLGSSASSAAPAGSALRGYIIAVVAGACGLSLLMVCACWLYRRRKKRGAEGSVVQQRPHADRAGGSDVEVAL